MSRRLLIAPLALAALLAPAGAAAATHPAFVSSAVKVSRGYTLLLVAGGHDLSIILQKSRRRSSQTYELSTNQAKITIPRSLSAGQVTAKLGIYGSVLLHFQPGGSRSVGGPPGCRLVRPGQVNSGTLVGSVHLSIGSGHFSLSRLPARAIRGGTSVCPKTPGKPAHSTDLYAFPGTDTPSVSWTLNPKGKGFELAILQRKSESTNLVALIYAPAGRAQLSVAADLSQARAKAAGPYLKGSVKFTRNFLLTAVGQSASGTVSGNFQVLYDLLGRKALANPTQALLSRS